MAHLFIILLSLVFCELKETQGLISLSTSDSNILSSYDWQLLRPTECKYLMQIITDLL